MNSAEHDLIVRLDSWIKSYAKRYDGRGGAEYDDLHQEGRIAVLLYYRTHPSLPDYKYAARADARMIDWCKYCKRGHTVPLIEEFGIECDD